VAARAARVWVALHREAIVARNKTIAADNATIKALRSVVFLPIPGGTASLATLTPSQAWPYVVALFGVFPANPDSPTCGTVYQGTVNTNSFNFGGWGNTSTHYDLGQTNNFAPPGDC